MMKNTSVSKMLATNVEILLNNIRYIYARSDKGVQIWGISAFMNNVIIIKANFVWNSFLW